MEKLIGPDEVAEALGIPVRTLYAWRTRGHGPEAMKLGRHLRYSEREVQRWLLTRTDERRAS